MMKNSNTQKIKRTIHSKDSRPSKRAFSLGNEYDRTIATLEKVGILTHLPRSKKLGVIGFDGKEYPAPTQEQLKAIFASNKKLVALKMRQGFTQLQLTPMAMPVPRLIELAKKAIIRHAAEGKIFRTKRKPTDVDRPARVNAEAPVWIWRGLSKELDTSGLVYFPKEYAEGKHQGLNKREAMQTKSLCAVPGWSIGLIEPTPIMPKKGKGKTIGGRKQLEAYSTPREYLHALRAPEYQGETGWTLEDMLTHFMVRLGTANEISHDRDDCNALWLLGTYIPGHMPNSGDKRYRMQLVPVGYWSSKARGKMYLSAHRTGNRFRICVARTIARLGR